MTKQINLKEKTLFSEMICEGKMLRVKRETVELPDGSQSYREFILHPGASVMVPILSDGKLVLVRQYRHPMKMEFYELPAGKLDEGESPLEAAKRELIEEIGYEGKNFEFVSEFHPCIGYADEKMWLYLVTGLTKSDKNTDKDEFLENIYIDFEEAVNWVHEGKISDTKTMLGILLAEKKLKEKE